MRHFYRILERVASFEYLRGGLWLNHDVLDLRGLVREVELVPSHRLIPRVEDRFRRLPRAGEMRPRECNGWEWTVDGLWWWWGSPLCGGAGGK